MVLLVSIDDLVMMITHAREIMAMEIVEDLGILAVATPTGIGAMIVVRNSVHQNLVDDPLFLILSRLVFWVFSVCHCELRSVIFTIFSVNTVHWRIFKLCTIVFLVAHVDLHSFIIKRKRTLVLPDLLAPEAWIYMIGL